MLEAATPAKQARRRKVWYEGPKAPRAVVNNAASLTTARLPPSDAHALKRDLEAAEKRVSAANQLLGQTQVALQETKDTHIRAIASIEQSHVSIVTSIQQDYEAKLRVQAEGSAATLKRELDAANTRLEEAYELQVKAEATLRESN